MSIQTQREQFEKNKVIYGSAKLTFLGVDGYDVYNCSTPIRQDGEVYIFGRVEKREVWAGSTVMLFREVAEDTYALVEGAKTYALEDPFVSVIHGEYILGGTHVRKSRGKVDAFYTYFFRGTDLKDLEHFTAGPCRMKDIRLVELANGKVGVFTRPRNSEIAEKYGCESMIGYAEIDSVDELDADVVDGARYLPDIFREKEWGGCNQVLLLADGTLGIIGHLSKRIEVDGVLYSVYTNTAFDFDPVTGKSDGMKIIGTRSCYPAGPTKLEKLRDCAFTSGIATRPDGRVDLYSGLCDCEEGRITIDDPFSAHGGAVERTLDGQV